MDGGDDNDEGRRDRNEKRLHADVETVLLAVDHSMGRCLTKENQQPDR